MITKSARETQKVGQRLAQKIKNGGIVCLFGDLGAGKTTLVQGIARGLGIKQRITSPTFIIMRQYGKLFHLDLYRLDDIKNLGIEDIWQDPSNILLIEWPEKIVHLLPKNRLEIKMKVLENGHHEIVY